MDWFSDTPSEPGYYWYRKPENPGKLDGDYARPRLTKVFRCSLDPKALCYEHLVE